MKKIFFVVLPFFIGIMFFGQPNVLNAQSVIVIPFFKEGENKRLIIESDKCYRTFETLIKEAFLREERFQLIDYLAIVRKIKKDGIIMPSSSTGIIEKLIQQADPDIYIIADIINFQDGKEFAIRINLTSYWTNTGETLSATTLDSGRRYYNDCYLLMNKITQNRGLDDIPKMEKFIQMMKEMMPGDESEPVQPISILFTNKSEDYKYTDKLTNGKLLFKEIQNWIKENSVDKKADADISSNLLRFSKVLIPVYDENGEKNSTSDYGANLLIHLSDLLFADDEVSLEFDFNVIGNTINYSLQ